MESDFGDGLNESKRVINPMEAIPLVEAIIFDYGNYITSDEIFEICKGKISLEIIEESIEWLVEKYLRTERGIFLHRNFKGVSFVTHPEYEKYVNRFFEIENEAPFFLGNGSEKKTRFNFELSQSELVVISYCIVNRKCTQEMIDKLFCTDQSHITFSLMEKGFLTIVRKGADRNKREFKTTSFLNYYFGFKNIDGLKRTLLKENFTLDKPLEDILFEEEFSNRFSEIGHYSEDLF
jgi:chromosome segregation and condensation protein ScpB